MQHHSHPQVNSFFQDWLPLLLLALIALLYLAAWLTLNGKKRGWNWWHTLSFVTGSVLVAIAMLPSLMQWAHHDLRGHMVQHLLIGMFAPIFLVLGAPITLALKALPVKLAREVTAIFKSNGFYWLSHPFTAFILNIGGMYALYLTPLYKASLQYPMLHYFIHLHFLAAGYLFAWAIIGPDPVPRRPPFRLRVFMLFISMAAHAFLSKLMYAHLLPHDSPHGEDQIREAAKLMYYWGDLAELLLAIVLFASWYQGRAVQRHKLPSLQA